MLTSFHVDLKVKANRVQHFERLCTVGALGGVYHCQEIYELVETIDKLRILHILR